MHAISTWAAFRAHGHRAPRLQWCNAPRPPAKLPRGRHVTPLPAASGKCVSVRARSAGPALTGSCSRTVSRHDRATPPAPLAPVRVARARPTTGNHPRHPARPSGPPTPTPPRSPQPRLFPRAPWQFPTSPCFFPRERATSAPFVPATMHTDRAENRDQSCLSPLTARRNQRNFLTYQNNFFDLAKHLSSQSLPREIVRPTRRAVVSNLFLPACCRFASPEIARSPVLRLLGPSPCHQQQPAPAVLITRKYASSTNRADPPAPEAIHAAPMGITSLAECPDEVEVASGSPLPNSQ